MVTIIGFEVRPLRVDYAIHEKNLIMHRFKRDGSIDIPSSQIEKEAAHKLIVERALRDTLGAYQDNIYDLAVYIGEDQQRRRDISQRPDWREEQLFNSMLWINQSIQKFFEIESMGITIPGDDKRFRRKALRNLNALEGFKYTRIYANWVALEGAKDVENI